MVVHDSEELVLDAVVRVRAVDLHHRHDQLVLAVVPRVVQQFPQLALLVVDQRVVDPAQDDEALLKQAHLVHRQRVALDLAARCLVRLDLARVVPRRQLRRGHLCHRPFALDAAREREVFLQVLGGDLPLCLRQACLEQALLHQYPSAIRT